MSLVSTKTPLEVAKRYFWQHRVYALKHAELGRGKVKADTCLLEHGRCARKSQASSGKDTEVVARGIQKSRRKYFY